MYCTVYQYIRSTRRITLPIHKAVSRQALRVNVLRRLDQSQPRVFIKYIIDSNYQWFRSLDPSCQSGFKLFSSVVQRGSRTCFNRGAAVDRTAPKLQADLHRSVTTYCQSNSRRKNRLLCKCECRNLLSQSLYLKSKVRQPDNLAPTTGP
jgi:hypothetical protein